MDLSVFWAKLLGLYLLFLAAIFIWRRENVNLFVGDFLSSKALIAYSGLMSLFIGLAIVITHPIWEFNWKGLITLIGYLSIVKGVIRFSYPEFVQTWGLEFLRKRYWVVMGIMIVLGLFLTYSGFAA